MNESDGWGREMESRGDAEVYAGDLESAKRRYGLAIDHYVEQRDYNSAIRTCRKLIRLAPDVVRTLYTLAYLLVGEGRFEEAEEALNVYATAVEDSGAESYARSLLTLLAYVTDDLRVRHRVGEILTAIGPLGEAVGWAADEAIASDSAPATPPHERWEQLLPIALRGE